MKEKKCSKEHLVIKNIVEFNFLNNKTYKIYLSKVLQKGLLMAEDV